MNKLPCQSHLFNLEEEVHYLNMEDSKDRTHHLFGLYPDECYDINKVKEAFAEYHIFASFRGNAIRVAPHLYNTPKDLETLVNCFKKMR